MEVVFTKKAYKDYLWWQKNDSKKADKINLLLKSISKNPAKGIGKPEPLKFELEGYWSRRINQEHRLVYTITKDEIYVISCKYHY